MTPTAPELLYGCVAALAKPPAPEEMGAFFAGTLAVAAMLDAFAAQECDTGAAVRVWENGVLRSLLTDAAARYDRMLNGALARASELGDGDYSLAALDAANAGLRRRLIQLHDAAEATGDVALDHRILALYREMAARRMLNLPTAA
jgi:hypothetical protein